MKNLFFLSFLAFYAVSSCLFGCTGIVRKAQDGSAVYARTLEFGFDELETQLTFIPRKIECGKSSPDQKKMPWSQKYASIGFTVIDTPFFVDGMNEKGLACGAFYFPGYAGYEEYNPQFADKTVSNLSLPLWILGNFSSVKEAIEGIKQIHVVGEVYQKWGYIPQTHFIIVDQSGESTVIEYVESQLQIYPSTLRVITNAPSYSWHETNARNYIGLTALNKPSLNIDGTELSQFGQGSGALGLPGDFTPPSRFIRAGFLNAVVFNTPNSYEEILTAFKILNQFDIPKGAIREVIEGKTLCDVTQWTSASDLSAKKYYFCTQYSRRVRCVDFSKMNLQGEKILHMDINEPEQVLDISNQLQ